MNYIFTNSTNNQNKLTSITVSLDSQNTTLLKAEIPEDVAEFQSNFEFFLLKINVSTVNFKY
jgi:hypothetical protein